MKDFLLIHQPGIISRVFEPEKIFLCQQTAARLDSEIME
jgi:hypothetical protein